jgi:hypothetical protein
MPSRAAPGTPEGDESVALFRRGSKDAAASAQHPDPGTPEVADDVPAAGRTGPWDADEVEGRGARVDLGAIWLPGVQGMELRMEMDQKTQRVTGVGISLDGSALQLQAFAAPRSEGIWDEIRDEIAQSVTKQGGSVDDVPGPFGRELLARLPARTPDGRTGHRPARFIGHDGPRWFLRGVISGKAAIDVEAAAALEAVFADTVVVRGTDARPPRDLLALALPGKARTADVPTPGTDGGFDPLTRGPEITEIR